MRRSYPSQRVRMSPRTRLICCTASLYEIFKDVRYSRRCASPDRIQKPRVAVIDGVLTYLDGDSDMPTFMNKVKRLMNAQGLSGVDLCKRIMMDRRLWSKLNSDSGYQPSKETAMAICIGLRLNTEQAKSLLGSAGYTLSDTRKESALFQLPGFAQRDRQSIPPLYRNIDFATGTLPQQ